MFYKTIKLSLLGKNKTSLISNILKQIYNKQANILQSNMHRIGPNFCMNMTIEVPKDISLNDIYYKNCQIISQELNCTLKKDLYPLSISINMADQPGIIHDTTTLLSEIDAELVKFSSNTKLSPYSNIKIFNFDILGNIPKNIHISDVFKYIQPIQDKYGCEISINKISLDDL